MEKFESDSYAIGVIEQDVSSMLIDIYTIGTSAG
jgi:hypothetical protein